MSLKIMVADPEQKIPRLMTSVATPLGHTVRSFEDYQASAHRGETQKFDMVFVGMGAPEWDGLELVHRIRSSESNRETIIVMFSASNGTAGWRSAFGEGADVVLHKPVQADCLRRMLAAFPKWKDNRTAARMPLFTDVSCSWGDHQLKLRSLNVSRTGMLLQPAPAIEMGQVISLQFEIREICASLNLLARIVRREGDDRVAVEFLNPAPEHQCAIHVFVTGNMKDLAPKAYSPSFGASRLYSR